MENESEMSPEEVWTAAINHLKGLNLTLILNGKDKVNDREMHSIVLTSLVIYESLLDVNAEFTSNSLDVFREQFKNSLQQLRERIRSERGEVIQ